MHPVRLGFRVVVHQPALILAEIAWRWSFGAAAWVLLVLCVRRILAGIDISQAEYLLARRSDMFLIADAFARVLYQALPALVRLAAILIPALAVIWIIAATLGRAATLQSILQECHPERASAASESKDPYSDRAILPARRHFGPLLALNFLRALFTLATVLAFIAIMILAGPAFPAQGANPTAAAVIWVILAALAASFWTLINWFLALAPIWIVRDGHGPFRAIADSLALFRGHAAPYVGAAWWFGFLRAFILLVALVAALFASSAVSTTRAAAICGLLIALLYFAAADFLYIARLAAFVALNDSSPISAASIQPFTPEPQPAVPQS